MSSSAPGTSSKLPHSGQNNSEPITFVLVAMVERQQAKNSAGFGLQAMK